MTAPTITDRVAELTADAQAILDTALAENRALTPDEEERQERIQDVIVALGELDHNASDVLANLNRQTPTATASGDTPGDRFANSAEMQELRAQFGDTIPENTTRQIKTNGSVSVGTFRNAVLTDPGTTGPSHVLDVQTGVAAFDLLGAITVVPEPNRAVTHHTAALTNVAAVVDEGDAKPEATVTWTPVDLTQAVIAQHVPITNQALNYNPGLAARVNAFLVNGVRAAAQSRVATQLVAWSGLATQSFDTDLRTTLRKAITKANTNGAITGAGPASIIVSANDAEALDLEMLSTLTVAPGDAPQQVSNIWRAPLVVVASGMADGFAYVGDPRQIVWYTRDDVTVSVGYSGDDFIRNQMRLLAETEGVTGVLNAGAIVKADLTA